MKIEKQTDVMFKNLYYIDTKDLSREAKFSVMLSQYTMVNEIMTREIAVSLIKEALSLGYEKETEYLEIYDIHAVVLRKGNKRVTIGRLKNGDWLVHQ